MQKNDKKIIFVKKSCKKYKISENRKRYNFKFINKNHKNKKYINEDDLNKSEILYSRINLETDFKNNLGINDNNNKKN